MDELAGRTAVITGASAGIGLATARRFVEAGAHVIMTGRHANPLARAAATLGDSATIVQGDVTSSADRARLAAVVEARGSIDVVFANAGGGALGPLRTVTPDEVGDILRTNVIGSLFTVQALLPFLGSGASVILSSSSIDIKGTAGFGAYAAAKAAVRSLTRSWAAELVDDGIRVNAIAPGAVATPGLHSAVGNGLSADEVFSMVGSSSPMGRVAGADEVAATVLFLASEASAYMTGSVLYVDGGASQF